MKSTTIKEIGVFNVEGLEVTEGRLEIRVPVDVVSEDLDKNLDKFFKDFSEHHPKVKEENISFEARIIFIKNLAPSFLARASNRSRGRECRRCSLIESLLSFRSCSFHFKFIRFELIRSFLL